MSSSSSVNPYEGMTKPGVSKGLLGVFKQGHLLYLLVRKDMRVRYRGSVLGWVWSYVKPLAQFSVYYFVMGQVLKFGHGIPNYAVYLFSGLIFINLFNEGLNNATKSIVANGSLVRKIYLPRELFPLSTVLIAFVNFLPQLVILLTISLFLGWQPGWSELFAIVFAIVIIMVLALGLGLFFGALNVGLRDAQAVVDVLLVFTLWLSPVMYNIELVQQVLPGWLFRLYELNPITAAVRLGHYGIWEPTTDRSPEMVALLGNHTFEYAGLAMLVALTTVVIGQLVFRKLEKNFAQDI